ncbi:MAG: hypothetical protein ACLFP4_15475 [Spirochaetales bacterium]
MPASEEHRTSQHAADQELEQYGVWVKAGPEDVDEAEAEDEGFALADLSEDDLELSGSEFDDAEIGAAVELDEGFAEDFTIGDDISLEIGDSDEAHADSLETGDQSEDPLAPEEDDLGVVDEDEILTIDDEEISFDMSGDAEELGLEETVVEDVAPIDAEPVDSGNDTLSLDELDLDDDEDEDDTTPSPTGAQIDIESDLPGDADDLRVDLDSLDVDSYAEDEESEAVASQDDDDDIAALELEPETREESFGLEDDFDELTLSSEEEDDDLLLSLDDGSEEETDEVAETGDAFGDTSFEIAGSADDALELEEDEDLDLNDLGLGDEDDESELDLGAETDTSESIEIDLSSLPDDDDAFGDLDIDDSADGVDEDLPELEVEDGVSQSLEEGFDDVSAVEDEMFSNDDDIDAALDKVSASNQSDADEFASFGSENPDFGDEPYATTAPAADTPSSSLLESIKSELSSIHSELGELKAELASLRSNPASASAMAEPLVIDEDEESGGFFEGEEDEDETIALSVDELDNIMNTAEFTEETGRPTDAEEFGIIEDTMTDEPSGSEGAIDDDGIDALDLGDLGDLDDLPDDAPVQEITIDEGPEDLGSVEIELGGDAELTSADELQEGDEQVDLLANIDIDAELADITELEDATETGAKASSARQAPSDDDLLDTEGYNEVFDAEPLDLAELDEEESLEPANEPATTHDLASLGAVTEHAEESPLPENLKEELRSVLSYMDQLLESLPEEKIKEFAVTEHFQIYQRLFKDLGLDQ